MRGGGLQQRVLFCLLVAICVPSLPAIAEEEPIVLPPISVTPEGFGIREDTEVLHELTRQEMERFPLIDNDVSRAAHAFPGVVANDFSARFEVRGGDKDEVLVRLDGLELYEPYHLQDFGGAISSIDLGLVRQANLLTGGFSAAYGDRLSAVYEISTRKARRDRVHADVGIDLVNAHAILEGPVGEGSWILTARRGYIDLVLALMDSDEELNPRYTDVFVKLEHPLSGKDILTFESLLGFDENEIHEDATDLISEYNNRVSWLRWRRLWHEGLFSDTFFFLGAFDQDKREGDWFDLPASAVPSPELAGERDERHLDYLGWQADVHATLGKSHAAQLGAIWRWSKGEYDYFFRDEIDEEPIQTQLDATDWNWDLRAYVQDEWQVTSRVALNAGLRWLYQNDNQESALGPRIAVAFRPEQRWLVRFAWGLYHQPVDRLHLPVQAGQAEVARPEEAQHWVLSMEHQPREHTSLRAEGYYKPMEHLVGFIRDAGRKNQLFVVPDRGEAWGGELFATHALSDHLSFSLGYAYSQAHASRGDQEFPRDTDQRHALSLASRHALSESTSLYVNWRFHTGTPYTESTFEYSPGIDTWYRVDGELNTERLPSYHSLDIRLTKNARYRSWGFQWYFQILNLYNRGNIHEITYERVLDDAGKMVGYEEMQENLLPIVPTLGMNVTF